MVGRGTTYSLMARAVPGPLQAALPSEPRALPDFEEIPPSASGIRWVHTAGLSPSKYLPETDGAGCAFLDYDNDGWMDLYVVNGGNRNFHIVDRGIAHAYERGARAGSCTYARD